MDLRDRQELVTEAAHEQLCSLVSFPVDLSSTNRKSSEEAEGESFFSRPALWADTHCNSTA